MNLKNILKDEKKKSKIDNKNIHEIYLIDEIIVQIDTSESVKQQVKNVDYI